jgi:hypothetical protein
MWQFIHKWHRRIGIVSALFVIMLVITGLMLNHTGTLGLKQKFVQNSFLLHVYNINPKQAPISFRAGKHWVSKVGERIYFDHTEIIENVDQLIGVVIISDEIIIAYDGRLKLVNQQGGIIEQLGGSEGVPAGMRAVGVSNTGLLVIRGSHGDYLVDLHMLDWHEESHIDAVWATSENPPDELLTELLQQYRGKGLPYERIVQDIHSGRILGIWGVLIVDAASILFFLLAISGVWMWCKTNSINR